MSRKYTYHLYKGFQSVELGKHRSWIMIDIIRIVNVLWGVMDRIIWLCPWIASIHSWMLSLFKIKSPPSIFNG